LTCIVAYKVVQVGAVPDPMPSIKASSQLTHVPTAKLIANALSQR